jgi:hypothetical protein
MASCISLFNVLIRKERNINGIMSTLIGHTCICILTLTLMYINTDTLMVL